MATPREILTQRLKFALEKSFPDTLPEVVPATDPRFGDYQTNVAMVLARKNRVSHEKSHARSSVIWMSAIFPRRPKSRCWLHQFSTDGCFLARATAAIAGDQRLGGPPSSKLEQLSSISVPRMSRSRCTLATFGARFSGIVWLAWPAFWATTSSPTIMSVTGAQFGRVIYGWKHLLDEAALEKMPSRVGATLSRSDVLEQSDEAPCEGQSVKNSSSCRPATKRTWRSGGERSSCPGANSRSSMICLKFTSTNASAKVFTTMRSVPSVSRLAASGVAEISEGALCIFFREMPALADKPHHRGSDGGFLYATTDLATIEYRVGRWNPAAIWYVVGAPQSLHFQQVFAAARKMGDLGSGAYRLWQHPRRETAKLCGPVRARRLGSPSS